MINQQLVDFIKKQLEANVTPEKISQDLLANGWNHMDIEEGFIAAKASAPAVTPVINPTEVYDPATGRMVNPITNFTSQQSAIKVEKHWLKKTIFILLIFIVFGAGFYVRDVLLDKSVYGNFFNSIISSIENIPIVKQYFIKEVAPIEIPGTPPMEPIKEPVNLGETLSIYTDPNGLYTFKYGESVVIDSQTKNEIKNSILLSITEGEKISSVAVITDLNQVTLNKLSAKKDLTKTSFENIGVYPVEKFLSKDGSTLLYVIDLGTINKIKLGMIFSIQGGANNPEAVDQLEHVLRSVEINKDKISEVAQKLTKSVTPPNPTTSATKTASLSVSDDTIKKTLKNIRIEAEVYYWKGETYTGLCKSGEYLNSVMSIKQKVSSCKGEGEAFAITAKVSDGYWCVDSNGFDGKASLGSATTCAE